MQQPEHLLRGNPDSGQIDESWVQIVESCSAKVCSFEYHAAGFKIAQIAVAQVDFRQIGAVKYGMHKPVARHRTTTQIDAGEIRISQIAVLDRGFIECSGSCDGECETGLFEVDSLGLALVKAEPARVYTIEDCQA